MIELKGKRIANLNVSYFLKYVCIETSKIECASEVISEIKKKLKIPEDENCKIDVHIKIPENDKIIEREAFNGCNFIKSITIHNKVTSIGELAFSGCTNISRIDIPDSVKEIGDFAFNNCKSLRTVKMSKNVEKIGMQIFHNCTNLKYVKIKTVDQKAFFDNEDAKRKVPIKFIELT